MNTPPPNDSRAAHTPTETNQPLGWAECIELVLEIVNERARLRAENARLQAALEAAKAAMQADGVAHRAPITMHMIETALAGGEGGK